MAAGDSPPAENTKKVKEEDKKRLLTPFSLTISFFPQRIVPKAVQNIAKGTAVPLG
jgi:hypothetical protein